jgi:lipopolysaccharide/colanic/teichoic acid biosynthesis glycosyltransferase
LKILKPMIDWCTALALLLLLFPLGLIISILNLYRGLPVFYFHLRPGRYGVPFELVKFRTIHPKTEAIDSFSNFLRKTSIDELPQCINILRGEMSFIGPRPLLIEYMPNYTKEQHRRHNVKPGITGWAQVKGRNALTLDEKITLDLNYVENVSFWFDLKILILTVRQLFIFSESDGHKSESIELSTNESNIEK